jgi:tungstate transport system substrate-binding protein
MSTGQRRGLARLANLARLVRLVAFGALVAAAPATASEAAAATRPAARYIVVASTTSTENSGFFRHLLPAFERRTGIAVRVVALGSGQALDVGRRGDADVVFVHDREAERQFVAAGFGVRRCDVMYNDFVLVGPKSDPARIAGSRDVTQALLAVRAAQAPFVSRGDRSGTHAAELRLWSEAGVGERSLQGGWYRQTGSGMGASLNTASAMQAYVLSDRATWLAFHNRGELAVVVEGDPRLFNQYGVVLVSPGRSPQATRDGQRFIDWLVSGDGQAAIAAFRIDGEPAFFPNARGACGR